MFLKLSELRVVTFAQFKEKSKDCCDFVDIEILTAYPCGYHFTVASQGCFKCTASYSYFMSIHNPTVVLKRNFLEIL